jgi:hypothetical protein
MSNHRAVRLDKDALHTTSEQFCKFPHEFIYLYTFELNSNPKHGGELRTFLFLKMASVQNKLFVYYFGGKFDKHVENKFLKIIYNLNKAFENIVLNVLKICLIWN